MSLSLFSKSIDFQRGSMSNAELESLVGHNFKWYGQSSFGALLYSKTPNSDYAKQLVYFDPFNLPDNVPKADLILISHDHIDHANEEDISKILGAETIIIADKYFAKGHSQLVRNVNYREIGANKRVEVDGFYVWAIPAYNLTAQEHPKGSGLGLILASEYVSIYHAGDSDLVPEIKSLAGKVDVALLPVGGQVTMNVESAAEAVKTIQPRISVPMHYDGHFEYSDGFKFDLGSPEDGNKFKEKVEGLGLGKVFVLNNQGKTNHFRV